MERKTNTQDKNTSKERIIRIEREYAIVNTGTEQDYCYEPACIIEAQLDTEYLRINKKEDYFTIPIYLQVTELNGHIQHDFHVLIGLYKDKLSKYGKDRESILAAFREEELFDTKLGIAICDSITNAYHFINDRILGVFHSSEDIPSWLTEERKFVENTGVLLEGKDTLYYAKTEKDIDLDIFKEYGVFLSREEVKCFMCSSDIYRDDDIVNKCLFEIVSRIEAVKRLRGDIDKQGSDLPSHVKNSYRYGLNPYVKA